MTLNSGLSGHCCLCMIINSDVVTFSVVAVFVVASQVVFMVPGTTVLGPLFIQLADNLVLE